MIGLAELPKKYAEWNHHWGSPNGHSRYRRLPFSKTRFTTKFLGPFAWQPNSATRSFEYPWVYEQVSNHGKKLTIVDIGGSLSGLQFVLAMEGHTVVNIDPGLSAGGLGWQLDLAEHTRLCRAFGCDIEVVPTTIDKANRTVDSADIVMCVSALEHFSEEDLRFASVEIPKILKPNGKAVFTVDLFIDLFPFTDKMSNRWGKNLDINKFLSDCQLDLLDGNRHELFGYQEFSPVKVLSRLPEFLLSTAGPCVSQCFTAKIKNIC